MTLTSIQILAPRRHQADKCPEYTVRVHLKVQAAPRIRSISFIHIHKVVARTLMRGSRPAPDSTNNTRAAPPPATGAPGHPNPSNANRPNQEETFQCHQSQLKFKCLTTTSHGCRTCRLKLLEEVPVDEPVAAELNQEARAREQQRRGPVRTQNLC